MGKLRPELNNRLPAHRSALGLTQEQLAKAAHVSRQTIIAIEGGAYSPSTVLALRLAFLLNVPVDELFQLPDDALTELRLQRENLHNIILKEKSI